MIKLKGGHFWEETLHTSSYIGVLNLRWFVQRLSQRTLNKLLSINRFRPVHVTKLKFPHRFPKSRAYSRNSEESRSLRRRNVSTVKPDRLVSQRNSRPRTHQDPLQVPLITFSQSWRPCTPSIGHNCNSAQSVMRYSFHASRKTKNCCFSPSAHVL